MPGALRRRISPPATSQEGRQRRKRRATSAARRLIFRSTQPPGERGWVVKPIASHQTSAATLRRRAIAPRPTTPESSSQAAAGQGNHLSIEGVSGCACPFASPSPPACRCPPSSAITKYCVTPETKLVIRPLLGSNSCAVNAEKPLWTIVALSRNSPGIAVVKNQSVVQGEQTAVGAVPHTLQSDHIAIPSP